MAAIAPQQHPRPIPQPCRRAQIPRHVPGRLDDPETPISEVIQRFLERAKRYPVAAQFGPLLGAVQRVEEPPVPLRGRVGCVAWGAVRACAGAEIAGCARECGGDGAAVVPVGVAVFWVSGVRCLLLRVERRCGTDVPEEHGVDVFGRYAAFAELCGQAPSGADVVDIGEHELVDPWCVV